MANCMFRKKEKKKKSTWKWTQTVQTCVSLGATVHYFLDILFLAIIYLKDVFSPKMRRKGREKDRKSTPPRGLETEERGIFAPKNRELFGDLSGL